MAKKKKRKRGNDDLFGHQQVNSEDDATLVNSGDATLTTPSTKTEFSQICLGKVSLIIICLFLFHIIHIQNLLMDSTNI